MPIPEDPSGQEIWLEFASRSFPPKDADLFYDLGSAANKILNRTNYFRKEFEGYGKPTVDSETISAVSEDESSITVTFNIQINKLSSQVYIEYTTDLNSPDPDLTKTSEITVTSPGENSITISNLDHDTTYRWRLRFYNAFNDFSDPVEDEADHAFSSFYTTKTQDLPQITEPSLLSVTDISGGGGKYELEFLGDELADNFQGRFKINDGEYSTPINLEDAVNWETDENPKFGTLQITELPNPGDIVSIQIKAQAPGFNDSDWSNEVTDEVESQTPSIQTLPVTFIFEEQATFNIEIDVPTDPNGDPQSMEVAWRWEYNDGTQSFTQTTTEVLSSSGTHERSLTVSGLNDDTEYEVTAHAWNTEDDNDVVIGNTVLFTTDKLNEDVKNLVATEMDFGNIKVEWGEPDSGPTTYQVQFRKNNGSWQSLTSTTNTEVTHSGFGDDYGTDDEMEYRVIGDGEDWVVSNMVKVEYVQTLTEPSILSITDISGGGGKYEIEFNGTSSADNFQGRFRINSGSYSTPINLNDAVNWETGDNPKYGTLQITELPNPGDTVYIQIRAQGAGFDDSDWSNEANDNVDEQQPEVTTLSPTNIGIDRATFRMEIEVPTDGFGDPRSMTVEWRWQYENGSTQNTSINSETLSSGTYTRTLEVTGLNDDTQYTVRAQAWNDADENNPSIGSDVTFTTDEASQDVPSVTASEQAGGDISVNWEEPEAGPASSYEVQYRINNGNWNVLTSTSSPPITHQGCGSDYSGSDDVQYRVRGDGAAWTESNTVTPSGCF